MDEEHTVETKTVFLDYRIYLIISLYTLFFI